LNNPIEPGLYTSTYTINLRHSGKLNW
jgi:hypothetical protein